MITSVFRPSAMRLAIAAIGPVMLAGCVVGPNYHRPALSAKDGYGTVAQSAIGHGAGTTQMEPGATVPADWWRVFHNSALDALVEQALANNPTIASAEATLRAAREQVRAQRGAYLPTIAASVQPSRQSYADNLSSPLQSGRNLYSLTTTQVSIGYSPDLFGANRRTVESLQAQADQQRWQLEAARLTIVTNLVQAAIQDALLRAEIAETRAIIADQQQLLASFQRQFALGQASKADLALQETQLGQVQATLPPLEKLFAFNRDYLAALVGRTPGEPVTVGFAFTGLSLPRELPLSLPANLVEQRPDVRMAEAELHAASAQVGIATAARLPNLQIDGSAGSAALGLLPKFGPAADFWAIAATLTQPIFDGGTLLHRQRAARATYEAAAAQYRATVVGAFQNTADTLHALQTDADARMAAASTANAARNSLDIARRQFSLGDVSRLVLIAAEQGDVQARLTLLQADANRYDDVVALFQALGGGWWNRNPQSARTTGTSPQDR